MAGHGPQRQEIHRHVALLTLNTRRDKTTNHLHTVYLYILSCHVQQLFYAFINLETIGSFRNMRYSYKNQCLPLFVLVSAHY